MTEQDPPPGWSVEGARWSRRFTLPTFLDAVSFLESIAPAIDGAASPPRVEFVYDRVDVAIEADADCANASALARALDEAASAGGGRRHGS